MYVWNGHIEILPQTRKFPFLIYIISASFVPNLAPLPSFVWLYQKVGVACRTMSIWCQSNKSWQLYCFGPDNANYGGTCKVSNLSLFVTQFRWRVGRFESSTGILSIFLFQVARKFFLVLGLGLSLSDTSLNVADSYCNALGLILPPAGRSITALFDLICKLMCTLCYSVQMKS